MRPEDEKESSEQGLIRSGGTRGDVPRPSPQSLAAQNADRDQLSLAHPSVPNHLDALSQRISSEATPIPDALVLTRIRREMIEQDEFQLDQHHVRRSEIRQFYGKMAFSSGGVLAGLGLIFTGHVPEGFVVMGVGFHWLAPDFVSSVWNRVLGKREKGDPSDE